MGFPVMYLGWRNGLVLRGLNDKDYTWFLKPDSSGAHLVLSSASSSSNLQRHNLTYLLDPSFGKAKPWGFKWHRPRSTPIKLLLRVSLCHDGTQASSVHQSQRWSEVLWISFVLSFYTLAFEISLSHCSSHQHMMVFPFSHFRYSSASLQILIFGAAHSLLLNVVLNCADFLINPHESSG